MIYDEKEKAMQYRTAEPDDMNISSPQVTQPPAAAPKRKKNAIITAGSLILAGAVILGVGVSMRDASSSAEYIVETTYNVEAVEPSVIEQVTFSDNVNVIDVSDVTSVRFGCNAVDLLIMPGDVFSYEAVSDGKVTYTIEDGVLSLNYSGIEEDLLDAESGTLYVTIPEHLIDSLHVQLNVGSLNISDINKEKMTFDLNAADLVSSNITASECSINVKAGNAEITGLTAEKLSVNGSASDAYFSDISAADAEFVSSAGSCSIESGSVGRLTLDGKMGEINYSGAIEENADISLDMGDAVINLSGSPSEYKIREVNCTMSDTSVNGMDLDEFNSLNDGGNIPINITANMSDVSINAQ